MTRTITLFAGLLAGLLVGLVLTPPAANAAAYRYWGYYQLGADGWQFATTGPDQSKPEDGSVDGWRFAVSGEGDTRLPRVEVTFDDLCADTDPVDGKKRVGVVIDYGRAADTADGTEPPAPVGHCAQVDEAASGLEVLVSVADVRQQDSLICALDGHPAEGCGDEVQTVSADAAAADTPVELTPADHAASSDATAADEDDGTSVGTWIGIGVAVLAVAALAIAALRRRSA